MRARVDLFTLRTEVAECDRSMAEILARRSQAVAQIQAIKHLHHIDARDPQRERGIVDSAYARMRGRDGRYSRETVERVWRAVFDGCESLEQAAVPSAVDGSGPGTSRY